MEYLACPLCGSTYFLSSREAEKVVFQVGDSQEPVLARQQAGGGEDAKINVLQIYCGSCSWTGAIEQLLPSHL